MEPNFQIGVIDTVFVGFHASLASVCFAGLVFMLRWSPTPENISPDAQVFRQRALLSLATALLLFITASAQYSLAAAYQSLPALAWILTSATAAASICAALLLYFTVIVLFRAHDLAYATRHGRTLFNFVWLTLGGYLWVDLGTGMATIAFDGSAIAEMPAPLLAATIVAVAGPMLGAVLQPAGSRLRRLAAEDRAFERLLGFVAVVALVSPVTALVAFAFETTDIDDRIWIGLTLAGMLAISSVLALTRLVLFALLDRGADESTVSASKGA